MAKLYNQQRIAANSSEGINKSQIYLSYIINNLPNFIFWKDSSSVFLGCNQAFASSAGFLSPEEIIGKTDYDMPWSTKSDLYIADDKAIMKTGIPKINYEESQKLIDGVEKIVLVSKVPMYDENAKIIGILGIYTDITERKRTEAALSQAKEMAEIANQLKTEFIHNMEHDIRTPFNGIWMLANLLERKEQDTEKKELLGDISNCAKELLDYCDSILDFSKTEAKMLPIFAQKFALRELINKVIIMEVPPAKNKQLQISMEVADEVPQVVIGDQHRLQRVLINLVSNAIKFTHQGYIKIRLVLAQKEQKKVILRIYIEDTGIGIPHDKQIYIYEKFTRVIPANEGRYKGYGLGLRVVKQLIEEMEGEIDVKSVEGKGTTFICTLPFTLPLIEEVL